MGKTIDLKNKLEEKSGRKHHEPATNNTGSLKSFFSIMFSWRAWSETIIDIYKNLLFGPTGRGRSKFILAFIFFVISVETLKFIIANPSMLWYTIIVNFIIFVIFIPTLIYAFDAPKRKSRYDQRRIRTLKIDK